MEKSGQQMSSVLIEGSSDAEIVTEGGGAGRVIVNIKDKSYRIALCYIHHDRLQAQNANPCLA